MGAWRDAWHENGGSLKGWDPSQVQFIHYYQLLTYSGWPGGQTSDSSLEPQRVAENTLYAHNCPVWRTDEPDTNLPLEILFIIWTLRSSSKYLYMQIVRRFTWKAGSLLTAQRWQSRISTAAPQQLAEVVTWIGIKMLIFGRWIVIKIVVFGQWSLNCDKNCDLWSMNGDQNADLWSLRCSSPGRRAWSGWRRGTEGSSCTWPTLPAGQLLFASYTENKQKIILW